MATAEEDAAEKARKLEEKAAAARKADALARMKRLQERAEREGKDSWWSWH